MNELNMNELKTKPGEASVEAFLHAIEDAQKREDAFAVLELMRNTTGQEPKMWGNAIIGFGSYHYRYVSGREGDWMLVAFSPRKQNLTLYLTGGLEPHAALLAKLGKHTRGKGCIHIKKLADIDLEVLTELICASVEHLLRCRGLWVGFAARKIKVSFSADINTSVA